MKKYLVIILAIFIAFFITLSPFKVYSAESSQDEIIDEILGGINENDFGFLIEFINSLIGENYTLKELIIKFLTGDISPLDFNFNFNSLLNNTFYKFGGEVIIYLLLIGILFNIVNIISLKNTDNNLKNIIYYISICIALALIFKVVETLFSYATTKLEFLSKTIETTFPIMFSISGLIGGFGVSILKPFTIFLSFLISVLTAKLFIPLLYFETSLGAVCSLSETVKLDGLKKTVNSIYKWILLLVLGVYSIALGSQSIVNSQYNGISVKILKYLTGSTIPVVGSFISGGMEVLISSAVLIKNSIGLIAIVVVVFSVGVSAIEILLFSFLIKFLISVCQPIIDDKYFKTISSVTDVFNGLAGLLLVSGFTFIITTLFIISATAFIF